MRSKQCLGNFQYEVGAHDNVVEFQFLGHKDHLFPDPGLIRQERPSLREALADSTTRHACRVRNPVGLIVNHLFLNSECKFTFIFD